VAPTAIGAVAAWLATRGTAIALDDAAPLVAVMASGVAGLAAYAAAASVVEPRVFPSAIADARTTLRR
jgi:hypothetical protein